MLPGFKAHLVGTSNSGIEFAVFRGRGEHRENIGYGQLREPAADRITIAQVYAGAKNGGVLQTVVGAALVVIGLAISGRYVVASRRGVCVNGPA